MKCFFVLRRWVTVLLLTCFVSVCAGGPQKLAAQEPLPAPANQRLGVVGQALALWSTARLAVKPDAEARERLRRAEEPTGDWGRRWKGKNCPPAAELRSLADDYLATPHPDFPDSGSPVPGLSMSWSSEDCGTFTYAAGLRSIEDGELLRPRTLMGIASMTKPVIAAVTLRVNEFGVFGPRGLDTPVARLLTPDQISALTVGDDPANPRCPGETILLNRETQTYERGTFSCPDLSRVTLRHLMISNHGMYDFVNEARLPDPDHPWSQYTQGLFFEQCPVLGLICMPPVSSDDGFDYLKAFGLKRHDGAVIGGNLNYRDLELSFGNTGFQLLGIILEHRTGKSLNRLIRELIVEPLGIDDMFVQVDPDPRRDLIANGYEVDWYGTGTYPQLVFNNFPLLNNRSLGLGFPTNINLAGGTAGLVANPRSYRRFLDALVNGGLLGRAAQQELDHSYVEIPDRSLPPSYVLLNGFGLVRERLRGYPGIPDSDFYWHDGRLAGMRCTNGTVHRVQGNNAPITGVICTNARYLPYDVSVLWIQFLERIEGVVS